MIFVTDEIYAEIASRFFQRLEAGGNYFNGKIEYDTPEFYATLTCSAIIYRSQPDREERLWGDVQQIVPVWWEFSAYTDGVAQEHDFSWSELTTFFPYA